MQHSNNLIASSTIRTCIAIAAFACTLLAGTLSADVVRSEQPKRGIDPIIHAIIDGFESGNLRSGEELIQTQALKPRSKTKKERVNAGHRNRLLVKFADELKVRIAPSGQLVSRTNKSIQTVIETALTLGVTLSPAAKVAESKVNELIARAEARSGKQMPDIGGVFWVDGPLSAVQAAADVFFIMPEIEWLDTPPLHPSENPHRGEKLLEKKGVAFNHPNKNRRVAQIQKLIGACMLGGALCQEKISQARCVELGGVFFGNGSTCKRGDDFGEPRGAGTACCTVFACTDSTFGDCMDINGIWFGAEGDTCADVEDGCPIGSEGIPEYSLCATLGNLPTYFAGDCYIDQNSQFVEDRHPFSSDAIPPFTVFGTAGCLDSTSFPNPQEGFIDAEQDCCTDISVLVPTCGTEVWDAVCASYANSGTFNCNTPNSCEDPFGPLRGENRQPTMIFNNDCPDGFTTGCWPFDPNVSFFTPQATTPDFFKMGLQAWATDEPISFDDWELSSVNAIAQFLPWPIGGGVIGDISYLINDWPNTLPNLISPETGVVTGDGFSGPLFGISQQMWDGVGLDLNPINPDADPGGMNAADAFSGLYGLGEWHEQLNEGPNGAYGEGVKLAVLDYAAFIQSYVVVHEGVSTTYGAEHEELINVLLEGPETGHDELRMYFDPTANFTFSPHHGSAVLGVIAADWDPDDPDGNVGIRGLVPDADVLFFPLVAAIEDEDGILHGEGRSATAWINAMLSLEPGDVIAATYNPQGGQGGGVNNLDYNAFSHNQITLATALGISVVIGAGMAGVDLLQIVTPDEADSGAIIVGAVSPGTPFKRYANGNTSSNFAFTGGTYGLESQQNVTCSAWGTGITTCGFGPNLDNWFGYQAVEYSDPCKYNVVASRSYTNNFSGTTAAAAIVAGCVVAMQGFANQIHDTKLAPVFVRHFIGGGSYAGMTPSDPDVPGSGGEGLFAFPNSDAPRFGSQGGTIGGGDTWDFIDGDGEGNLTGMLVNPWSSCQRLVVDPIFDTPGIEDIMIINGDYNMGNSGSIAALDSMYFSLDPVYKEVGDYPMPDDYTGPGDHVTYISTAWVSDIYLSGQLRGGLSPLNVLEWDVVMLDSTYTSTILLLYMWDFSRQDWVQASTSELLTQANLNEQGKHELNFLVPRSSRMINQIGQYHARFVTVTQSDGDNQLFPYFYDQIRVQSGSFPGGPIVVP